MEVPYEELPLELHRFARRGAADKLRIGSDGELYFYDTTRDAWLSVNQFQWAFGESGSVANTDLLLPGGSRCATTGTAHGHRIPLAGTPAIKVVGISISQTAASADTGFGIGIYRGLTLAHTFSVGTTRSGQDMTLDVDMNGNAQIAARASGTSGGGLVVVIYARKHYA